MRQNPIARNFSDSIQHAQRLLEQGLVQGARDVATEVAAKFPSRAEPMFLLARIEQRHGNSHAAIQWLKKCLAITPDSLPVLSELAQTLHYEGRCLESIAICDRGLSLQPGELAFVLQKASAQDQRHDYAAAWETLQPVLTASAVPTEAIGLATRVLGGLGRFDDAIVWAHRAVDQPQCPAKVKRNILFYLAKVYDKLGRYDDAMAACVAAHQCVRTSFDADSFVRRVDGMIALFSQSNLPMLCRATNSSEMPVFVVGMPRSGTTLVEQIISVHPMAHAAGEIHDIENLTREVTSTTASVHVYPDSLIDVTPQIAQHMSDSYVRRLQELGPNAQRVTNKMLEQYEHLGFIWMLLPKARIIHVRRDPLDTCLSCYTRHLNPERMPYSTALENLGMVYRQHERLMDHWKKALDLPILTVQYEDLVADQERHSRRIIEFLGLPWDDRCLRYYEADRTVMTLSYDQVNRPIYDSSIGRWKHYEKHLAPLNKALAVA